MRVPKRLIKIATTNGPPAKPNFTGIGTPGMAKGTHPKITPNIIPKKIGIKNGSFNLALALPT